VKSNVPYWSGKIERNKVRDAKHVEELGASGWVGMRVVRHKTLGETGSSDQRPSCWQGKSKGEATGQGRRMGQRPTPQQQDVRLSRAGRRCLDIRPGLAKLLGAGRVERKYCKEFSLAVSRVRNSL
jgi:hypothetical protein